MAEEAGFKDEQKHFLQGFAMGSDVARAVRGLPILAGFESLVLTLPMILWLRRALTQLSPEKAVEQAIQLVDDHFGGDPMLGFPHIRFLQQNLAQQGELEKLVAWYSR